MNILIAADKFKGSLTASEVCRAIKQGVQTIKPRAQVDILPLADGGEGSLDVLASTLNFKTIKLTVNNPLFKPVDAYYGLIGDTAFIEMAQASGLLLLKEKERTVSFSSTFGTGELILDALQKGAKKIYLFIGGSATNDAGIGMAAALGYIFLDKKREKLIPVGKSLAKTSSIEGEPSPLLRDTIFYVVSDVKNPLYGTNGAAMVFAKQKGGTAEEIVQLDKGLQSFNTVAGKKFKKNVRSIAGAGAAGGLGAGAMYFLNAEIKPGIETIMDLLNFNRLANNTDWVITGEGKVDTQTLAGKVVSGVINRCHELQIPVSVLCGTLILNQAQKKNLGAKQILSLVNEKVTEEEAIKNAYELLTERAKQLTTEVLFL